MAASDMAALSLKARGRPLRINGRRGTFDTYGVPYRDDEGELVRKVDLSLSIPADVPVVERDEALYAGRDYVVRSIGGDGFNIQRLELQKRG